MHLLTRVVFIRLWQMAFWMPRCVLSNYVCACTRGNYQPTCIETFQVIQCMCFPSWLLDVNECSVNGGGCEHHCENNPGGFECHCQPGYKLHWNKKDCIGKPVARPTGDSRSLSLLCAAMMCMRLLWKVCGRATQTPDVFPPPQKTGDTLSGSVVLFFSFKISFLGFKEMEAILDSLLRPLSVCWTLFPHVCHALNSA